MTNNCLLNFYREGDEYVIEVRDLDGASPNYYAIKTFRYTSDIEANESDLVLLDDTVLIAPHNKQLNLIDGVWYLNDFKSTTPSFEFLDDEDVEGSKAQAFFVIKPFPLTFFSAPFEYSFTLTIGNQTTNIAFTGAINIPDFVDIFVDKFNTAIENDIYVSTGGYETVFVDSGNNNKFAFYIQKKVVGDFGEIPIEIEGTYGIDGTVSEQDIVFASKDIVLSGGAEPSDSNFQTLDQNTDYYYTCRYVYLDGHKTDTCFPKLFTTSNNIRRALLRIDSTKDLNNTYTKIEVFRRKDGENFFFIGDIIPEQNYGLFIDNGFPNVRILDDQTYVWTKFHQTHEIVRDRYVRANVHYNNPDFTFKGNVTSYEVQDKTNFPTNVTTTIYARVRYTDGTLSFHKKIGSVSPDNENSALKVELQEVFSNKDIKEIAFYGKYDKVSDKSKIDVNSIELYNSKIPSLATRNEDITEQDKPINTHVFLGWKYVYREAYKQDDSYYYEDYIVDSDFNSEETGDLPRQNKIFIKRVSGQTTRNDREFFFPDTENFLINGQLVSYDIETLQPLDSDLGNSTTNLTFSGAYPVVAIYRIAFYNAIKESVRNSKIQVEFNNELYFKNSQGIANKVLKPISLLDVNELEGAPYQTQGITVAGITINSVYPKNSRLYFVFDDEDLNLFNDSSIQNTNAVNNYTRDSSSQGDNNFSPTFSFSILNIEKLDTFDPDFDITTTSEYDTDFKPLVLYRRVRNYLLKSSDVIEGEGLIYLKSSYSLDADIDIDFTGYEKNKDSNLIFWSLFVNNLYENIITEDDLRQLKTDYPNQLIWSDPYIQDTNASGNRRFRFESFLNISRQYGEIVSIKYINNILVVFCEKGVALVNVGEVLTQNTSGQTVVASENFLTGEQWILKNVPNIQRNSIKQFESMLFFSDEKDVWMFTGELQNVSQGAVKLASPATHYGAIDVLNKEYRISDGHNTWAYSIEMSQWFGPYTYSEEVSVIDDERLISFNEGNLVEHNQGNRFWYKPYTTTIESVANDLQDPSIDKIFRKLYFEMDADDDTKLSYTKDTQYQSKKISQIKKKNDNYHIGVDKHNKNSKRLFWKIDTTYVNFVLRMSSYFWNLRKRR